jgi:hypothetical protein
MIVVLVLAMVDSGVLVTIVVVFQVGRGGGSGGGGGVWFGYAWEELMERYNVIIRKRSCIGLRLMGSGRDNGKFVVFGDLALWP